MALQWHCTRVFGDSRSLDIFQLCLTRFARQRFANARFTIPTCSQDVEKHLMHDNGDGWYADQAASSGQQLSSMCQFQLDLLDGAQHNQVHHDGDNSGLCVILFRLESKSCLINRSDFDHKVAWSPWWCSAQSSSQQWWHEWTLLLDFSN